MLSFRQHRVPTRCPHEHCMKLGAKYLNISVRGVLNLSTDCCSRLTCHDIIVQNNIKRNSLECSHMIVSFTPITPHE